MDRYANVVATLAVALVISLAVSCFAYVDVRESGTWPQDWPKELEPLRPKSRSFGVGTGIQEKIYEIPFSERDTFERIWPVVLKLKSEGAPLTLRRVEADPPEKAARLLGNTRPAIRIYAPSGWYAGGFGTGVTGVVTLPQCQELVKQGKMLYSGPPWPKEVLSPDGRLPEFVQTAEADGVLTWARATRAPAGKIEAIMHRARVDIELVVDGQVIDLNRVLLPPDTSIIDKRWNDARSAKQSRR